MKTATKPKTKKPILRQQLTLKVISDNLGKGKRITQGQAMREAGYSKSYSESPNQIKDTRAWDVLLKEELGDGTLMKVHTELLQARRLEHMVFPPESQQKKKGTEVLSDDDIKQFLLSVNCVVRKIIHQDLSRHVYFWAYDNMARDKALDKGYKLKSKYAPEEYNLKFKGFTKSQIVETILSKITKKKHA